jgi:AcrR family transcriptional regulator
VEKKRGRYHHGDLRRALLDAALEVLSAEGASALTLREVARRAGVTHAAPYRHFADKQTLLAAVAEEGFRMLTAEMLERSVPLKDDPVRALQAIGLAYVRFATTERAHFQVMFGKDIDWAREQCELEETADRCFDVLISAVEACQTVGAIRPGTRSSPRSAPGRWCTGCRSSSPTASSARWSSPSRRSSSWWPSSTPC